MEPRTLFGALRLIVEVNVLLGGALLLARTIATRSGQSRRQKLRCAQAAFVLAFALPLALRALPHQPLLPAAAQVWSGGDVGHPAAASTTFVGATWRAGEREISLDSAAADPRRPLHDWAGLRNVPQSSRRRPDAAPGLSAAPAQTKQVRGPLILKDSTLTHQCA